MMQDSLMYKAYTRLIASEFPGRDVIADGQAVLCELRDAIATFYGCSPRDVQEAAEYDAAYLKNHYQEAADGNQS